MADCSVLFIRVALSSEQVQAYRLPTSPPKKEGRAAKWQGETCQLEALAPDVINQILQAKIEEFIDFEQLEDDREEEVIERAELTRFLLPRQ